MNASGATPVACCGPLGAPLLADDEAAATAELFKALADPARIRIVNVLATTDGPVCVCELIEPLGLTQPAVSYHLRVLLQAGLVQRERRGQFTYYALRGDALSRLAMLVAPARGA